MNKAIIRPDYIAQQKANKAKKAIVNCWEVPIESESSVYFYSFEKAKEVAAREGSQVYPCKTQSENIQ
jgi:hypothetical protein